MWTRAELKEKAKGSFKRNYWKTVLVSLLLLVLAGGIGAAGSFGPSGTLRINMGGPNSHTYSQTQNTYDSNGLTYELNEELNNYGVGYDNEDIPPLPPEIVQDMQDSRPTTGGSTLSPAALFAISSAVAVVAVVGTAIVLALKAFIVNPLSMGASRFFLTNLNQPAEIKEVTNAFDNNYREVVKTMFLRDIFTFLWSLLLVIPGIIKSYEYRMIPYLLAEDATMTKDRAFAESKRMMDGNKWRAFVLDLSFIGWYILCGLTLGILAVFYVAPYKDMTDAALYEELRYGSGAPDTSRPDVPSNGGAYATSAGANDVPVPPFASADAPSAPQWSDDVTDDANNYSAPSSPEWSDDMPSADTTNNDGGPVAPYQTEG